MIGFAPVRSSLRCAPPSSILLLSPPLRLLNLQVSRCVQFLIKPSTNRTQSSVDPFPQTSLLAQTNSLGVVTGQFPVVTQQPTQPAVVTQQPNQPAVVTSQPVPADIPAVGPGVHTLTLPGTGSMFNQTRTVVVSANNSTTVQVQTSTPVASASGASGSGASGSGASGSGARTSGSQSAGASGAQSSQGAAANVKVAAGGLVGFGAFVAAILLRNHPLLSLRYLLSLPIPHCIPSHFVVSIDKPRLMHPTKRSPHLASLPCPRTMTTDTYPRHAPSIPYTDPPSPLQTLDIWLPRPLEESDPAQSLWVIYIHGGAWRDPLQTSSCANPTVAHLRPTPSIAGIASLNYRLSPYASHPTCPSTPSNRARNVAHPTHINDIASGILHLQREHGLTRWIGVGHSCGATMLCQYVSQLCASGDVRGPEALLLSAGIYNLPLFLRNHAPPACSEQRAAVYADIVCGAFGRDPLVYRGVSPVAGRYGTENWPHGKLVVLAHSYDDELVERAQRDVMCVALVREGWSIVMEDGNEEADVGSRGRVLEVRDIKGTHDFIWEDGEQGARLIQEVADRLTQ
ncbi:hypothetical protein BDU57DRAFT_595782 [Ampelomyces quisqualis]|uniref:Kynurenine formamidase n=1 Tax=Ampelomyces quisqualis TaxID=50730 RepID=A0A6A5QL48_AMPQU|nr:hypothetical protein BDU57DRAFT_595782 [Ampelomyces quisqualis]